MIKAAIEKIIDLRRPETITHEDRTYVIAGYSGLTEPCAEPIRTHTLTALVDYMVSEIDLDFLNQSQQLIHVADFNTVLLHSELFGPWHQRHGLMNCESHDYPSPGWLPVEEFIIHLNADYVRAHDYEYLAKLVAGITQAAVKESTDNGITQTVTVKKGVSMVGQQEIKNPVMLQPYRTFPEVDQPVIEFTFRIKEVHGEPYCRLFESDGNRWKLDTIRTIKTWIENQLEEHGVSMPVLA